MSESQQRTNHHLLLTIVMIVLETVFSFVLKHDRVVRVHAKKFVEKQIVLKINSYLPYFDFYVQFSPHGLLFDSRAPVKPVDLEINSTLLDLLRIIIFGNRRSIKAMRIAGDPLLRDEFRDLILHFSVPKLFADWRQWLKEAPQEDEVIASRKRIAPLLEKIDQQRVQINSLLVEVKLHKSRIRRMEQKNKYLKLSLLVISLLFITLLIYTLWPK